MLQRIEAVGAWHDDIERDGVGLEAAVLLHGLLAVARLADHFPTGIGQAVAHHFPHEQGVIHDQDSIRHGIALPKNPTLDNLPHAAFLLPAS
jgi:hypothetical protein